MRHWITLVENATHLERSFYLHITPVKNYKSIKTKGLVPNYNGGNYDDMRWTSLNGVYASKHVAQLHNYIENHDLKDYLVVVIEVDMETTLPDEDLIDIIFDHILEQILIKDKITLWSEEFEEMYPTEERFQRYVGILTKEFHRIASGKYHIDMNQELIQEAAECWLEMKVGLDGEAEMIWGDIKDSIVSAYPKMVHPILNTQHSIRIPKTIGFEGNTRIVAIIKVDYDTTILFDQVPPEARTTINELVQELVA